MPGPKSHDIFYKQLKQKLSSQTLTAYPHYDDYNVFAQGHDFFIYHKFYQIMSVKKLNQNVQNATLLQEYRFPEFVYNYLKTAQNNGAIEDEQTRIFLGPGYIMHHLLDAYTHPFIIYNAGDYTRDAKNPTWTHGIVETLIDIYLMEIYEQKDARTYPTHEDFNFPMPFIQSLTDTLNQSMRETYNILNGGDIIEQAITDVALFIHNMKYDPYGFKKWFFDLLDPLLKGTAAFSYHQDIKESYPYLNLQHEPWVNPMDDKIISTASFMDLYNQALQEGALIVDALEHLCQSGNIHRDDIYNLIPNISSSHGLECGTPLRIRYKKNQNNQKRN